MNEKRPLHHYSEKTGMELRKKSGELNNVEQPEDKSLHSLLPNCNINTSPKFLNGNERFNLF